MKFSFVFVVPYKFSFAKPAFALPFRKKEIRLRCGQTGPEFVTRNIRKTIKVHLLTCSLFPISVNEIVFFITGGWRKLHNERFHDLYFLPNIIIQIK